MATTSQGAYVKSATAGEDLSSAKFTFIKYSAEDTIVQCSAATDKPDGVLVDNYESGKRAEFVVWGPCKVKADAVLSTGDLIGPSADGQADAKVPGTDVTEYAAGKAMEDAAAAGDIIEAWVNCINPHRAA
jgi:hypothetical protein